MAEEKAKKVSVKIFESTRDLLEKEKMRFKSAERPDYAEIIAPAVARHLGQAIASREAPARSSRWYRMLEEILASDDHEAIQAVQQNILVFHRIVGAEVHVQRRTEKRKV